jgi:hypothetical protein
MEIIGIFGVKCIRIKRNEIDPAHRRTKSCIQGAEQKIHVRQDQLERQIWCVFVARFLHLFDRGDNSRAEGNHEVLRNSVGVFFVSSTHHIDRMIIHDVGGSEDIEKQRDQILAGSNGLQPLIKVSHRLESFSAPRELLPLS